MKKTLYEKNESLLDLDLSIKYKVLDIGCGHGVLLAYLSGSTDSESTLMGIDEMENSVRSAKESYPNTGFRREKFMDSHRF